MERTEFDSHLYTLYVKSYGKKRDGAKHHLIDGDLNVLCGSNPDGYQFLGEKLTGLNFDK